MMSAPTLRAGALMIVYNEEPHILEALESLSTQTRPLDQIVLVDDGSTDASREILENFSRGNPKVHLIQIPNGGRAQASNAGLELLLQNVNVVFIFDGDDVSVSHRVEWTLAAFENDSFLNWHSGQMDFIDEAGTRWGGATHYPTTNAEIHASLANGTTPVPHAASAFRSSLLFNSGFSPYYSPRMRKVQDLELLITHASRLVASCSDAIFVHYRRTQVDRSFRAWSKYRPWHHYAIASGNKRARLEELPAFESWYASKSLLERYSLTDPHLWLVHRLRDVVSRK